jgi:hypothetical protein
VVALAILALAAWQPTVVLAPLLVAAGLASATTSAASMVADSRSRADQRVVLRALALVDRTAGPQACIAYDVSIGQEWTLANDQTFLPTTRFKPLDSRARQPACSELLVTPRLDLASSYPGARLMAAENYAPTYLWVLPGPLLDRLSSAGLLLPAGFPTPLPISSFVSRLEIVGVRPVTLRSGGSLVVDLAVTNAGRGAPWPSQRGFTAGHGWVSLAVALSRAGSPAAPVSSLLGASHREQLVRELWPGETTAEQVRVTATDAHGRALPPGRYEVTIGLVQEGEAYFADHGDPPLRLAVQVSP